MAIRRALACLVLLAAAVIPAAAVDVTGGLLKLTLHEGTGRFSLAAMATPADTSYTPLLFADDPRTSSLSLLVGNRVYRLGDGTGFKESVSTNATGGQFAWTSSFLAVTETFTFISSSGSVLADGVRIDLQVRNLSEQKLDVGVRYLFDTWLGEESRLHFTTPALTDLGHELTLAGEELPSWWISPKGKDASFGLQSMLTAAGLTAPDRVVFANWKRLNDAAWSYETSATRGFNLLPYSVNDSAACQYYDPRALAPGEQFILTLALGKASPAGFSGTPSAPVSAAAFEAMLRDTLAAGAGAADPVLGARTDLATINLLLAEIDRLLAATSAGGADQAAGAPSPEELAQIEQALATLKERAANAGR